MTDDAFFHGASHIAPYRNGADDPVVISGSSLRIEDIVRVARHGAPVQLTDDADILERVRAAREYVRSAVEAGEPIYGITTGFGGMADVAIAEEDVADLQENLVWYHKTGAGERLPTEDVRAAMLLRANSHMRGASAVRLELVRRFVIFLNEGVTPHVYEFGSIGASGDLVPLTYITGAIIGLDECFTVDVGGETMDAPAALHCLRLEPLHLRAKEGLAMINGTSMMTGIAANCVADAHTLLSLALGAHALMFQALRGTNQSFHPFIHAHKPHTGQVWTAERMLELLTGSDFIRDELDGGHDYRDDDLIQDRYSLRCLPQYTGPIVDGLQQIGRQVEVEANSTSDNPLTDVDNQAAYHGGNFLGQYIGVAMDQLRYYLGLLVKHLDVQISVLVAPEFNGGLPASLVGNTDRTVNMGLKGLQLSGNSIMPLLSYFGNSLVDRFPTHAEQFNQNINSQGFGSAMLAREAIDACQQYMAIALMFGVQAVDLRSYAMTGTYDPRRYLSPATRSLYDAVRSVVNVPVSADRPYVWDDDDFALDAHIAKIAADIGVNGRIPQAMRE